MSDRSAWLLDLQVGGQVLRYATRAVTVTDARGVSRLYRAGLSDLSLTLDGLLDSTGLEIVDREVSWPELAAAGEALERARAELRHWSEGELLEEALLVLVGGCEEPEYGDPDAPARLSLTLRADDGIERSWPSPSERVDTSTWTYNPGGVTETYDDALEGVPYQTVFGYPGEGDTPTATPRPVVPTPLVLFDTAALPPAYLLLGRGTMDCVGGVAQVVDQDDPSAGYLFEDLDVIAGTDDLGQAVTLIELPPAATMIKALGHKYYAGLSSLGGRGGGSLRYDGQGVMSTLADVAPFCLRGSGRTVDLQAQEAERESLERYAVDGVLTEEVQLVTWFESTLLPLFPIVRARTARGMYWRHVNYAATVTDAVTHLDADRGEVRRASSIRSPRDGVYNHFQIDFQLCTGAHVAARRILTAEAEAVLPWWLVPDLIADARIAGSPACARSQSAYGLREAPVIASAYVWKESTASLILAQRALRDTFPRRQVSYTGPASELRALRVGSVVAVTDSEVSLSRAVALVAGPTISAGRLASVALEVLDPRRLG